MSCVWPGVAETLASAFTPASILSSEDLPTFDRPMKANSGTSRAGQESRCGALIRNLAARAFMAVEARKLRAISEFGNARLYPAMAS